MSSLSVIQCLAVYCLFCLVDWILLFRANVKVNTASQRGCLLRACHRLVISPFRQITLPKLFAEDSTFCSVKALFAGRIVLKDYGRWESYKRLSATCRICAVGIGPGWKTQLQKYRFFMEMSLPFASDRFWHEDVPSIRTYISTRRPLQWPASVCTLTLDLMAHGYRLTFRCRREWTTFLDYYVVQNRQMEGFDGTSRQNCRSTSQLLGSGGMCDL